MRISRLTLVSSPGLLCLLGLVCAPSSGSAQQVYGLTPEQRAQRNDSSRARSAGEDALNGYYRHPERRYGPAIGWMMVESCDGSQSEVDCRHHDIDLLMCPHGLRECRPDGRAEEVFQEMIQTVDASARRIPGDPWLIGQAVYAQAKAGRFPQALELADVCAAERWWCHSLYAYLYGRFGDREAAAAYVDSAYAGLPDEVRCAWSDIESLLPRDARDDYRRLSCAERAPVEARAWWLADPLHLQPGNDRWTEHVLRRIEIALHEDLWQLGLERMIAFFPPGALFMFYYDPLTDWREYRSFDGHRSHHDLDQSLGGHHRGVVAIGFPDSWYHNPTSPQKAGRYQHWREWVSVDAARYRFFPEAKALTDPASAALEDWTFEPGDGWERYTPHFARFVPVTEPQVASFLREDSMIVALAVDTLAMRALGGPPLAAGLVLARDERDEPTVLYTDAARDRYVFRATRVDAPFLSSLEIFDGDVVGRARWGVVPPWVDDPWIATSDLLAFEPRPDPAPESVDLAIAQMRGSAEWSADEEIGLFWEVYGVSPGDVLSITVSIADEDGGFLRGLRSLVAGDPDPTQVSYTEEVTTAGRHVGTFTVDLANVSAGRRSLNVTVSRGDEPPVTRTRMIRVEGR